MPRPLDYASTRPPPRRSPALLAVAATWWGAAFAWWLILGLKSLDAPGPRDPIDWIAFLAALAVLASLSALFWMSLVKLHAPATRTAVLLMGVAVLVILFLGLASLMTAIGNSERLVVIAIILAGTLGAAVLAGLSAWLFRCWLQTIELAAH